VTVWAGPDLNEPYSATEYMRADALRRLVAISSPVATLSPPTRMPAFDTATLSDRELNDPVRLSAPHGESQGSTIPTGK
jgi:hypothetical protein